MNIKNMTPHAVTVVCGTCRRTFPPSGIVPRCSTNRVIVGEVDGITIHKTEFGDVENLPEYEEGTFMIVSAIVANACKGRTDLIIPDEAIRDEHGTIIGCKSFAYV